MNLHLLLFSLALGSTAVLRADLVRDANMDILSAIRAGGTPPPLAVRNMAILHTAVYDAVNGVSNQYQHYEVAPAAPSGASFEAAVAAATNEVMNNLYGSGSATWNANFTNRMNVITAGQAKTEGEAWGRLVATTILNSRINDGASTAGAVPWNGGPNPGEWRPTPPANATGLFPQWGDVTPFALANPADFLPAGPAPLNSAAYTAQYNEVKAYGGLTGSLRSLDQTEIAQFWADGPGTATPPGHWNTIAQGVLPVGSDLATMTKNARAFAALNVAMADAGIVAWDAKYQTNYWRPITAIREGENDLNGDTVGDPSWTPLLTTPPFPEYVSGHSSFSGAGAAILTDVLGTDAVSFTTTSDGLIGVNRSFATFSSASEEAGMSRIYGGIHFQQANVDGRLMGAQVADYVLKTQFGAIPEPSGMVLVVISALGLALQRRRRK